MLTNIPSAEGLDEVALRLHFDAWIRLTTLVSDFDEMYGGNAISSLAHPAFEEEWDEYIGHAQPEIGIICATIQQSAELRLKAIICETSPFLLLLNSNAQFKKGDMDFSELRTLDAVDLPGAVRALTDFSLPNSYLAEYSKMRRLRNQVIHLGSHSQMIKPDRVIDILCKQYVSLWPDGRWLYRRVRFDGNSARNFFHDSRWSSSESDVMAELPVIKQLMDSAIFKKSIGVSKGKLKGCCPSCLDARASKWDDEGHATAYQISKSSARCAMCERDLTLAIKHTPCGNCGTKSFVHNARKSEPVCFHCGNEPED